MVEVQDSCSLCALTVVSDQLHLVVVEVLTVSARFSLPVAIGLTQSQYKLRNQAETIPACCSSIQCRIACAAHIDNGCSICGRLLMTPAAKMVAAYAQYN